jgi:uncharacterized protein YdeI (BOF family)
MKKMVIALHLALVLALLIAPGALAQEEDLTEVDFIGTVISIDPGAGTFTVETEEFEVFTVVPPEDFDLTSLQVGDEVEVEGTLDEDGTVLAASVVIEAADEDDPTEVEFTGIVTSINSDEGTFTVRTEDGEVFTVVPPEDFDLTSLEVGDEVEVEGTLAEDGTVLATSVKIEVANDDDDQDDLDDEINYFCRPETEGQHPVAVAIAETYGVSEEQVLAWFCEGGFGFGQIMLALQTSQASEGDPDELLARRSAGEGWGQIWISMELIGQESDAHPPGRPEDAGPPEGAGPPEDAGPPEGVGPPEWLGLPDDGGPPENIIPPSRP